MAKAQTQMKSMRLVAIMLMIALVFAGLLVFAISNSGVAESIVPTAHAEDHVHDGVTFTTAWNNNSSLPSNAGNYYLTTDVALSNSWSPKGVTRLCLNGHKITISGNARAIVVGSGVEFHLYDCDDTLHYYTLNGDPSATDVYSFSR